MPRMPGRYSFLFRIARRIFETFSVLRGDKGSSDGHSEAKSLKSAKISLNRPKSGTSGTSGLPAGLHV